MSCALHCVVHDYCAAKATLTFRENIDTRVFDRRLVAWLRSPHRMESAYIIAAGPIGAGGRIPFRDLEAAGKVLPSTINLIKTSLGPLRWKAQSSL
jgi:hypothetical protein